MCSGRALDQLPLVFEQRVQIAHVPFGRFRLPCTFDATGDRVAAFAAAEAALPAEALFLDAGGFGLRTHMRRRAGAVTFAEGVSSSDERDSFLVVHRHAPESLADVTARSDRIRVAVRPFRVHVDQAHLNGGERIFEFPVTGIALVAEPLALGPPVNVLLRLPDILTPTAKAKGLESH